MQNTYSKHLSMVRIKGGVTLTCISKVVMTRTVDPSSVQSCWVTNMQACVLTSSPFQLPMKLSIRTSLRSQIEKPTVAQSENYPKFINDVPKILSPWSVDIEEKLINLSMQISVEIPQLQGLSESVEFQTNCLCWGMGGCQNCPTS